MPDTIYTFVVHWGISPLSINQPIVKEQVENKSSKKLCTQHAQCLEKDPSSPSMFLDDGDLCWKVSGTCSHTPNEQHLMV